MTAAGSHRTKRKRHARSIEPADTQSTGAETSGDKFPEKSANVVNAAKMGAPKRHRRQLPSTTNSMRRFLALFSSESLGPSGFFAPKPSEVSRAFSTPPATR